MQELEDEDIKDYGCKIPEGFDGKRAIEALKTLQPVRPKTEKIIKMRDATPEERESVAKYIKSISKPTDSNCDSCEHQKETYVNGSNCYECVKGIRNNYKPKK